MGDVNTAIDSLAQRDGDSPVLEAETPSLTVDANGGVSPEIRGACQALRSIRIKSLDSFTPDAVARARSLGFATVVFSNQSGVARGLFDEDAVRAVNHAVEGQLLAANAGAVIDRQEFCPFHPEGTIERYRCDSELRKPKPGMIYSAADALTLDLTRSWVIGDAPRDIEAGRAAGCRTILFRPPDVPVSPAAMTTSSSR